MKEVSVGVFLKPLGRALCGGANLSGSEPTRLVRGGDERRVTLIPPDESKVVECLSNLL